MERGPRGGCRSINWDFIIANNHPKLLCVDIYAEANRPTSLRPLPNPLLRARTRTHSHIRSTHATHSQTGANRALPRGGGVGGDAILVIAFWLLFTRRVHTVFASTGLTNVYRQKLTGNLFGRIVDGNYYFIDGHARATDLLYPLLFIGPCSVLRTHWTLLSEEPHQRRYAVLCIKTDRDIASRA